KCLSGCRSVKIHSRVIRRTGLLDSGVGRADLGELLQQVRPLFKGPIQRLVNRASEGIWNGELFEWLHLNRRSWHDSKRFAQIALGDFLGSDYGLQFVLRLRGGASS